MITIQGNKKGSFMQLLKSKLISTSSFRFVLFAASAIVFLFFPACARRSRVSVSPDLNMHRNVHQTPYGEGNGSVTSEPPQAIVYVKKYGGANWEPSPWYKIGITPTGYFSPFSVDSVRVLWPDGTESEVKSSQDGSRNFRFVRGSNNSVVQTVKSDNTEAGDNKKTVESTPARIPSVWTPDTRRCPWVLAIGVGQYKDQQVPALPFARSDAEQVRDWFLKLDVKGITRDNVHILLDEQATRENILAQIDWLRRQALPEDAVFVYFAGHGAPELAPDGTSVDAKYLVLYDTDRSNLFATGFPLDDLTRKLDMVKAKTQVVILEACYTGPVGQEILKKSPTADLEIRPRLIQQLGEKGGRVILSASSGRQMAIGSEEIKGGLFTHYLLDSWGDGGRRLLSEQFEEARYQVRRASNQLGSLQEPIKFGDQNVDIILKAK